MRIWCIKIGTEMLYMYMQKWQLIFYYAHVIGKLNKIFYCIIMPQNILTNKKTLFFYSKKNTTYTLYTGNVCIFFRLKRKRKKNALGVQQASYFDSTWYTWFCCSFFFRLKGNRFCTMDASPFEKWERSLLRIFKRLVFFFTVSIRWFSL
jgi:hypothetical protein